MMVDRYPGQNSEYGGGSGQPQRYADGSAIPLEDLSSSQRVSERARLMRMAGIEDYDPAASDEVGLSGSQVAGMSFAQREAYEADVAESERRKRVRAAMVEKTNGYSEEAGSYIGESGEGNGVQPFGS